MVTSDKVDGHLARLLNNNGTVKWVMKWGQVRITDYFMVLYGSNVKGCSLT